MAYNFVDFRCPNCDEKWNEEDLREGAIRKLCGRCKWVFIFEWKGGQRVIIDKVPKPIATIAR